ncbi:addiction module antidote protein [Arenimonas sp.]|uniref:addiction module antidote protein n=1 Tax=Arenimonas sp. TaxID=1872635 RepID=UPI0035B05A6B
MTKTRKFDIGEHLTDEETMAEYLDACIEEGGQELFLKALGDVMKAIGVTEVTKKAGIASRSSAYKSFSENGKPELATVGAVLDAMGMRFSVVPKEPAHTA